MKIITISREFGSGGRELGKRLADELGYDYYDREIERLTDLAIQEQVMKRLNEIDYNVTINGEKLTDAIIEQFNKGFRK